jgi:hypothetical protein
MHLVFIELGLQSFKGRPYGLNFIDWLLIDGCYQSLLFQWDECFIASLVEVDGLGEEIINFCCKFDLWYGFVVLDILL